MKQINESEKTHSPHPPCTHGKKRSDETYAKKKKHERKRTTFKGTMQYDLHIAENPMVVHVHVLDRIKL